MILTTIKLILLLTDPFYTAYNYINNKPKDHYQFFQKKKKKEVKGIKCLHAF